MTAGRLVLLAAAVIGVVAGPRRLPSWVAPLGCTIVALAASTVSWHEAGSALRPLLAPLGFLLAAIPLAALLDRFGYFRQLAGLFEDGPFLVPGLWVLAAGTVAVLNLDAAVVLLTPLYVTVAGQVGASRRFLGVQPVLLALLASSFLPVSNLTNLIAAARTGIGPVQVLEHLAVPGLAACVVGYFCYRGAGRLVGDGAGTETEPGAAPAPVEHDPTDTRVLAIGSAVVALVLAGFLVGPGFGVNEWVVALGADLLLVALTRQARLAVRAVPWGTALIAACLGVLAASAVRGLPLGSVLGGHGPLASLRTAAVTAAGANVVNNLPALLVALPFVSTPHSASCSMWPALLGVNMGPGLLVTGSLASLLWIQSMKVLGAEVHPWQFLRMGGRVILPAFVVALGVLLLLAPAVGCG